MATKVTPHGQGTSTKPAKAKKEKVEKKAFKLEAGKKAETAIPSGFSFADFAPLKKKDFAKKSVFFSHMAERHRYLATQFDERAKNPDKVTGERAAKRLEKMQGKMKELIEQLRKSGANVDLTALLASAQAPAAEVAK